MNRRSLAGVIAATLCAGVAAAAARGSPSRPVVAVVLAAMTIVAGGMSASFGALLGGVAGAVWDAGAGHGVGPGFVAFALLGWLFGRVRARAGAAGAGLLAALCCLVAFNAIARGFGAG